jgi:mannose-6-phosphate isomerase-like protein (cupin superfamily)
MALDPGPLQVIRNFHSSKSEVLADIDRLDLWPTTYVSERMDELPLHWHDVDNCGYVLEGRSYVLNERGERIPLGPGDKLVLPAGAVHAEGEVSERMVYIVGISVAANLLEALTFGDSATSPLHVDYG